MKKQSQSPVCFHGCISGDEQSSIYHLNCSTGNLGLNVNLLGLFLFMDLVLRGDWCHLKTSDYTIPQLFLFNYGTLSRSCEISQHITEVNK